MSKPPIPLRRLLFSSILLCLLTASVAIGATFRNHVSAHADGNNPVPAKYAFMVFFDGGHPELYNATNAPFINSLKASGASYTNAQAQVPADSITNIMGAFTGTDASHHGYPYETFWDYHYNHLIELDETPVLPPGITEDRNVGRACTLFQAAKAAGLRTAFIAKYPAYDVLDGPNTCPVYSGIGVDNLQTPTFANFTGTPQQYDQMNFDAVRAEINSGANRPNIFGLYAVAPNSIMKQYGINSPQVAQIIQFEDSQVAQTVALLKSVGIYNQTEIALVNDHGNTALTEAIPDHGPGSIDQYLNDNGIPTVQTTTDRVALVYLQNPSQTQQAINLLSTPQNMAQFGIQAMTPSWQLGAYMVTPQDRTPSFIVWPTDGSNGTQAVVYDTPPLSKLAEHGGRGSADQNVMIVMVGPGVQPGFSTNQHVWLMQVGSTVAADMCLNLANATYAPLPGTSGDDNNCQNYHYY
ncbi:MAG TPA: alkaline phosphatase family protein [Ktedonobacteraceae bacterium]|nr:alkaline phosphatase family protein [Ktedonobacteraceae bacterium]